MASVKPLSRNLRHASDYRDDIEHVEVARILSDLPDRHPARTAYTSGAWEGANTLSLSRLCANRLDVVERLIAVYTAHAERVRAATSPEA
jgi:hypothetical protein